MNRIDEQDMPKRPKASKGVKRKAITYDMPIPASKDDEANGLSIIRAMEWYLPLSARAAIRLYEGDDANSTAKIVAQEFAGMTTARKGVLLADMVALGRSIQIMVAAMSVDALQTGVLQLSKEDFDAELNRQVQQGNHNKGDAK